MTILRQAFLLPVDAGECFCVHRRPRDTPASGMVLHLPAFGDEMNKARNMTARAACALAARGFGVLQIDLLGCGDSSGDHRDATLSGWIGNLVDAIGWLRREHGTACPLWLWGLRSGALLVAPLLESAARDASLLLWQPVLSGKQQLQHLLRQKLAGELLDTGGGTKTRALRERLHQGEALEIGGYAISPRLADELGAAAFDVPAGQRGRAVWLELSTAPAPTLSAAARSKVHDLRSIGVDVQAMAIEGPGFWQSAEIECSEPMIEATIGALTAERRDAVPRDPAFV